MQGLMDFAKANWSLVALLWLGVTALFATMPRERPRSRDDYYRWSFDAVHQFANLRNGQQRPILPETQPSPENKQPGTK